MNNWIKISDETNNTPEDKQSIIITVKGKNETDIGFCRNVRNAVSMMYISYINDDYSFKLLSDVASHWMPTPKPATKD